MSEDLLGQRARQVVLVDHGRRRLSDDGHTPVDWVVPLDIIDCRSDQTDHPIDERGDDVLT